MAKAKGVPEFMHCLFVETLGKKVRISRQPVNFLAQAMQGHHRAVARQLSFAEDKGKHGDEQVEPGDGEDAAAVCQGLHGMKDRGGVELVTLGVVGEGGVQGVRADTAGYVEAEG